MQQAVFAALFIVQNKADRDPCTARPSGVGRIRSVTAKIAGVTRWRVFHGQSRACRVEIRWLGCGEQKADAMAEGKLTTHVLDTAQGIPAAGVEFMLYRVSGNSHRKIAEACTNQDGRTDAPILEGKAFTAGSYELIFKAGPYLEAQGLVSGEIKFLDQIPIRFGIADAARHFHVPLLLSPYGYSTYRGS